MQNRLEGLGASRCVVVNDHDVVAGVLDAARLSRDSELRAGDVMDPGPSTFRPLVASDELAHHLHEAGEVEALLTTNDGRLVGVFRPRARGR